MSPDESDINTAVSTSDSDEDEEIDNSANANDIRADSNVVIFFLILLCV